MARLVDTEPEARRMYETFHSRESRRRVKFNFTWPNKMQEAGRVMSELYRSNKWKMDLRDFEDYKHVVEAPQYCYMSPGFLRDASGKKAIPLYGEMVDLEDEMPKHFTILAPLIGIQVRLYDEDGRLPRGDNNLFEIAVPHGMLGGARFPGSEEAFLFVYTKRGGVHMLITGDKLDVEKDGIVG